MNALTIDRLLIANRGEIALRVARTASRLGIETVALFTEPDRASRHVREADLAVRLPGDRPAGAHLDIGAIIDIAKRCGADAVHPGYGFLSENPDFATACADAGLVWVGPQPQVIVAMGSKIESKRIAEQAGVPLLPGAVLTADIDSWDGEADRVGFPLLVKASAGGGGRGIRLVTDPADLRDAVTAARREALASFGDDSVFLERALTGPRHVEVQIFGDAHGTVLHLGDRDCSVQRRHQKLIEEAPAPGIPDDVRDRMHRAAVALADHVGYHGAGTVEFLYDAGEFFFLEMNTRLQVEHPVTEAITGLDLVEWQLLVAAGHPLPLSQHEVRFDGHAIEARLVAEDSTRNFRPASGTVHRYRTRSGPGIRIDGWIADGAVVSSHFDSLLAKIVAHGQDRADAVRSLARELGALHLHGIVTNRDQLANTLSHPTFMSGDVSTALLDRHPEILCEATAPNRLPYRIAVATAAADHAARAAATVQRDIPSGWRNVVAATQRIIWTVGDSRIDVGYAIGQSGAITLHRDGESDWHADLHWHDEEHCSLEHEGLVDQFAVHAVGDRYHVNDRFGQTDLEVHSGLDLAATDAGDDISTAPLPGTIVAVEVAAGEEVAEGALMIVLEAMKMEYRICAGRKGTVEALGVAVGDTVEANQVLIRLTAEPKA